MTQPPIPGFRDVPRTGVIYVMHRAAELGAKIRSEDGIARAVEVVAQIEQRLKSQR